MTEAGRERESMTEGLWGRKDVCPASYFNATCNASENETLKLDFHFVPASAGMLSAIASIVGCVLMLVAYYRFSDFRTGSRRVATFLALSNLLLAIGSAIGYFNTLWYGPAESNGSGSPACSAYSVICTAQAFVTWSSALSSFTWTAILAWYLHSALVRQSILIANRSWAWVWYWLLSILIPMGALSPLLVTSFLGYSPYANGGGCFITTVYNSTEDYPVFEFTLDNTALIVTIKCVEVASYIVVVSIFTAILCHLRKPIIPGLDEHEVNCVLHVVTAYSLGVDRCVL